MESSSGTQAADPTAAPAAAPPPRKKRQQVVRACDWCRKHRAKCDNDSPCSNCRKKGGECSNDKIKATSLPHAYREIERLRCQIRELEAELAQERGRNRNSGVSLENTCTPQGAEAAEADSDSADVQKFWSGIYIRTARSAHGTWYGPSSLFYFIGRITSFLSFTQQQRRDLTVQMLPTNPAGSLLDGNFTRTTVPERNPDRRPIHPAGQGELITPGDVFLGRTQEEYFIGLFWQSYNATLSILDEAEFKNHHRSLWTASNDARKSSALVDIVIALCMQYGISMMPDTSQNGVAGNSDAGGSYYRRCQLLLTYEQENPTISTLQCHLLSCIYLRYRSFQNTADSACGLAVRTAYTLGLHLEPPATMPPHERELWKRLWWALYVLDGKIGLKLGRPFLVHRSSAEPDLPDDRNDVVTPPGHDFARLEGDITWLSFNLQSTKLFLTARKAHTALYSNKLNIPEGQTVWDNSQALDALAEALQPYMKDMEEWANNVPDGLKTKRLAGGSPFSTDESGVEIEQFAPLWLQRQRLLLEQMYHNLCTNLCRPFISFASTPESTPSLAYQMATKCALHAITLTRITHTVLSSTSVLAGWHEMFQWQWDAAMTVVGYVLAYPAGAVTIAARRMLDLSVEVFGIFGSGFAVARSAARIVRDLRVKMDYVLGQVQSRPEVQWSFGNGENGPRNTTASGTQPLADDGFIATKTAGGTLEFNVDDLTAASMRDVIQKAWDIEQWGSSDMLWSNNLNNMNNMGDILPEPLLMQGVQI